MVFLNQIFIFQMKEMEKTAMMMKAMKKTAMTTMTMMYRNTRKSGRPHLILAVLDAYSAEKVHAIKAWV